MHPHSELPTLRSAVRLGGKSSNSDSQFYAVQFYPYTLPGADPVFAVTGKTNTLVCRPSSSSTKGIEVLRWFKDQAPKSELGSDGLNSLTWSQDIATGDPLLCVTGHDPKIKILNVRTGELVRTLIGHGGGINDLVTSPICPTVIASVSEDHSIRFWDLDPKHAKQPCVLICSGEGHKMGILSLAFHRLGRYVLSGGLDTRINLWAIPELPGPNAGTDKPAVVHYPHFSTTAIHTDYVDCVLFYEDLILSRSAKENKIILWKINGFASDAPHPPPSTAPTMNVDGEGETRSAFGSGGFQILLTFDCPSSEFFYMRFGLFTQPFKHPILAMGNSKSRIFFWDLQNLETGSGSASATVDVSTKIKGKARAVIRDSSVASSGTGSSSTDGKSRYPNAFTSIKPHKSVTVPSVTFTERQAAWSVGGEWCVVVGDHGMICIFRRWDTIK